MPEFIQKVIVTKIILTVAIIIVVGLGCNTISAQAHCQLPCGIFDDHARGTGNA